MSQERRSLTRRRMLQAGIGLAASRLMPPALAADNAAAPEPFEPTWESLTRYRTPEWFRDAKFGIWAHWGPQCQPGQGDWYARQMYIQGNPDYNYQCAHYGHPSKAGFKDVIPHWHAEDWDPEHLIGLYKAAGAKYFMCLANHHDNFDNYASTYQPWNSVALGPKRDLVGGWERAARRAGLRFGVSVHAAHAWLFYELAQSSDQTGPLKGVPYDGNLTKADGAGLWWEGLDPQDLYAQDHTPSVRFQDPGEIHAQWAWDNGASRPSAAYIDTFYRRTLDLIDKYHPDQVYFDDTVLPLYPISDIGLRITAHLYNQSLQRHQGRVEAVVNGKILDALQQRCLVMDLERGVSNRIEPYPFQTDTCIGNWHYDINLYHNHGYKTADQVTHMLVDIVSKNGNLMLNIPLPGSGMPDPDELAFLADFTRWMQINRVGLYGTRPWHIFGEGPGTQGGALRAQGFNESNRRYTPRDFRFTAMPQGEGLYAFAMAWPEDGRLLIRSLARGAGRVEDVRLLGHRGKLTWAQTPDGLAITLPAQKPCEYLYGLRIAGRDLTPVPVTEVAPLEVPGADGRIVLRPDDADLTGNVQTQMSAGVVNIGYWDSATDTVSWRVRFPAAGDYQVSARVATADGPTTLRLDAGDGSGVTLAAPLTGGWDRFQTVTAGPLHIDASGERTVTARAADPSAWHALNLADVTLMHQN